MKKSKRYLEAAKKVVSNKVYAYQEAVELIKQVSSTKFNESVDLAVRLNIQQKHSIRGSLSLPHSVDTSDKKIVVFAEGPKAEEAKEAGAVYVGSDDLIQKIRGGWLDFDVAIATPDMMKEVGKLGPILGKRGLMPNPKVGTVTLDVKTAVNEFKKGKREYKADKTGIIHFKIGKASMTAEQIIENGKVIYQELMRKKPNDIKGDYVKSVYVSSTMGPGIKIDSKTI
ncbi:MAG TPA: 50S ribosomal protein L1 [Spirochaetia bacterium]|nr:MAG: 50S ribosomal protein L1 [Spirochaetes bacterium GWB1_36_13]HCL58197.1 50S ribosomal protein L1 [Spirochaetia bacterium]